MRWIVVLAALALVGCRERSFDERYADAAKSLREKTKAIDAEIASQAALATPAASASPPTRETTAGTPSR